ncbi:DUF3048 domain-containing protein [Patescibacteria group bacterium]|nr:DUF3048 domain-containing protein [Patescibacteria group bacterium]
MQRFLSRKAIGWTVAAGAALAVLLSATMLGFLASDQSAAARGTGVSTAQTTSTPLLTDRNPLDGTSRETATSSRPVAIMVENHVDARPLSGIASASLVFEAPVEGGITRLLAVFDPTRTVPEIGPVRSARPYYLDWAGELDAMYVHVGGSPEALTKIATTGIRDLNQFFADKYFWRATTRNAPHNVYTSTVLLEKALTARDWNTPDSFPAWNFVDADPALAATSTSEIRIPFSSPSYAVRWRWDPVGGRYLRFVGGAAASDRDGKRQVAANVVVISVETAVLDDIGRLRLGSLGSGDGMLFRDGFVEAIQWKKKTASARLQFFSKQSGEEVFFRPGTTWVEVVPEDVEVTTDAVTK